MLHLLHFLLHCVLGYDSEVVEGVNQLPQDLNESFGVANPELVKGA